MPSTGLTSLEGESVAFPTSSTLPAPSPLEEIGAMPACIAGFDSDQPWAAIPESGVPAAAPVWARAACCRAA